MIEAAKEYNEKQKEKKEERRLEQRAEEHEDVAEAKAMLGDIEEYGHQGITNKGSAATGPVCPNPVCFTIAPNPECKYCYLCGTKFLAEVEVEEQKESSNIQQDRQIDENVNMIGDGLERIGAATKGGGLNMGQVKMNLWMAKKKEKYKKESTGGLIGTKEKRGDNPCVDQKAIMEGNAEDQDITMMLKNHDNLTFHFNEELAVPMNEFFSDRAPALGNSTRANQDLGSCAFDESQMQPTAIYQQNQPFVMVKETTLTEQEKTDLKGDLAAPTGLFNLTGTFKIISESEKKKDEWHYIIAAYKRGNIEQLNEPQLSEKYTQNSNFRSLSLAHGSHYIHKVQRGCMFFAHIKQKITSEKKGTKVSGGAYFPIEGFGKAGLDLSVDNTKEYKDEEITATLKVYGINDTAGILGANPQNIEDLMNCYQYFMKVASNPMNIIGVDKIYLQPWLMHPQVKKWPNLIQDYKTVHGFMKRQNMQVIVDTFMRVIRNRDWAVQKNSIKIIGYLDSQPEFFDQILIYNDYYLNIELQDAIQDFIDSVPRPPHKHCYNNPVCIFLLCLVTVSVYFWIYLCGGIKTYNQQLKEWGKACKIDFYEDFPKLQKLNDFLKKQLEDTWPEGFVVNNQWLKKAAWRSDTSRECKYHVTYKTHVEHWDQQGEKMHISYADHDTWNDMERAEMLFTTREKVRADRGAQKGHYHVRGYEYPGDQATQIRWHERNGLRNGEYELTGSNLETSLDLNDGNSYKYSSFRGEFYQGDHGRLSLPEDQKHISKANLVAFDHFAARQQLDDADHNA